ncbi:unnamed protein product [Adineta ricciae]|uniref:Uncharacterized protein n=1 Tax=Adineta ricciae TaxID=249248 RepID=A0A815KJ64_ADIRI|nr:unnamed protein product [Adineta ricciae]
MPMVDLKHMINYYGMLDIVVAAVLDRFALFWHILRRTLAYAFSRDYKLTLAFLSITPLVVPTFNLAVELVVKFTNKAVKTFACAASAIQEALHHIQMVTAFYGQQKEIR